MRKIDLKIGLITLICFFCQLIHANSSFSERPEVRAFIHEMVQQHHFKQQDLNKLFAQVIVQPKIIASMTKPYEKKPWDVYKNLFLQPERVHEGIDFWKQNQATLQLAEKKYGVPANIIVAILGVETRYGKHQGEYRVIDALSTLAFDYPPRSPFFKKELAEFLLLCREHHTQPTEYLGSYAGAIGKPQFMPSSYRYYADDFAGLPKKDLMHDDKAVIASVANYFRQHGWNNSQAVAQEAQIKGNGYKHINTSFKSAEYPLWKLKQAGVLSTPLASPQTPDKAGLIHLLTQTGQEYWVAYPNFYVITRYNTSPQYALVVYLFSEQLKQQWTQIQLTKRHAFA